MFLYFILLWFTVLYFISLCCVVCHANSVRGMCCILFYCILFHCGLVQCILLYCTVLHSRFLVVLPYSHFLNFTPFFRCREVHRWSRRRTNKKVSQWIDIYFILIECVNIISVAVIITLNFIIFFLIFQNIAFLREIFTLPSFFNIFATMPNFSLISIAVRTYVLPF